MDTCHHFCVHKICIYKDTIRHYTTLYYSKSKQLHVSALLKQPSSSCNFQKFKQRKIRICNNTSTSKTPWPSSHSTNMQDLLFSVGKAKCFPLNTLKEYLRVEVQFHAFLTSENDKREVKSQFHPIIALFRINGLQCRLSGQLRRRQSRRGGFGKKSYRLQRNTFLNKCYVRLAFRMQNYLATFCALK